MSEAKHTPKPWTQERDVLVSELGMDDAHVCVEFQANGYTIGYWVPTEWSGRCPDSQLIAAAPDLLEACKAAERSPHHPACPIATGKGQTTITHDDCTCHVGKARVAIAKAEGR